MKWILILILLGAGLSSKCQIVEPNDNVDFESMTRSELRYYLITLDDGSLGYEYARKSKFTSDGSWFLYIMAGTFLMTGGIMLSVYTSGFVDINKILGIYSVSIGSAALIGGIWQTIRAQSQLNKAFQYYLEKK